MTQLYNDTIELHQICNFQVKFTTILHCFLQDIDFTTLLKSSVKSGIIKSQFDYQLDHLLAHKYSWFGFGEGMITRIAPELNVPNLFYF